MTIEFIEGFHELDVPSRNYGGLWTVCGSDVRLYYLLNGDRYHLIDLDVIEFEEIQDNLYFDTELVAHQTASEYYLRWGLVYPYIAEWMKCTPKTNVIAELESQIMVFE